MSSISKKNTGVEIDILALDFGLYPGSKKIRESLLSQKNENKAITIMDVNTKLMSAADWDDVLDSLLKAKRCITL